MLLSPLLFKRCQLLPFSYRKPSYVPLLERSVVVSVYRALSSTGSHLRSQKASSSSSHKRPRMEDPQAPEGFQLIKEGKAAMLFPQGNEVFYNKVQVSWHYRPRNYPKRYTGLMHSSV